MVRKRVGFTLIELLIVIAIIGILIAAIAVAVTKAKEFANNNDQKANIKNLATACRTAEVENQKLPPAWGSYGRPRSGLAVTSLSAFVNLLPYLENKATYDANAYSTTSVKVFQSAMDPSVTTTPGITSFVANLRVFSLFGSSSAWDTAVAPNSCNDSTGLSTEKFNDGAGNTVLFTTKQNRCNGQVNSYASAPSHPNGPYFGAGLYLGTQIPASNIPLGTTPLPAYQVSPSLATTGNNVCNRQQGTFAHSFGGAGLAVGMGDASVRNLSFAVTGTTWARAIHPADGLALGSEW